MEWIITVAIAVGIYWFFFVRAGNLSFWQLAAKYPDEAYHHFSKEDCWFIDEIPANVDEEDVVGPFKLIVPELGRSISVYGLARQMDDSQAEFVKQMS